VPTRVFPCLWLIFAVMVAVAIPDTCLTHAALPDAQDRVPKPERQDPIPKPGSILPPGAKGNQ
jgi:hypothetical protein